MSADGSNPKREAVAPGTLGAVLYSDPTTADAAGSEQEWVELVQGVAGADARALQALYKRANRLVFTLALRITQDRQAAEEVTVDVFHDLWRRASTYDPENGTVVGWIMNQARSRAIDRFRFDHRKKRAKQDDDRSHTADSGDGPYEAYARDQRAGLLQDALTQLTSHERQAIETAFFGELTHTEVAAKLQEPLGTIKTRIRSALAKLRKALMERTI
ncbi:MAG: sigma-70 family RNA polymerase sigma factor [Rhodospirillaceae bacterium]